MADYDIAHLTGVCAETNRTLGPGEEFHAVLFETATGFERRDYSAEAWNGPPSGYFSHWKSRVPRKEEKRQLLVDPDTMTNLFLRLATHAEEVKQHFRFVLSLILMRKRILKYHETVQREGREFWKMQLAQDQSIHEVLNPRMTDEQIEAVSRELGAILHGDSAAFAKLDKQQPEAGQGSE